MNKKFNQTINYVASIMNGFFNLPAGKNIVSWLRPILRLTNKEKLDAGLYLGGQGRD